jgi:23S rRNA (cytosine1962-C5)-methyltransferase
MSSLHFRLPGRVAPLGHWLAVLLPDVDRSMRKQWVEDGCVRVDDRLADRPGVDCPAGARVEINDLPAGQFASLSPASSLPTGLHSRWIGLIDDPPWPGGLLRVDGKPEVEFIVRERRDGLATIQLDGPECEAETICALLADAGMPLVGDLSCGGLGAADGVRLVALESGTSVVIDWPEEPAWCREVHVEKRLAPPSLCVSDETARAIRKGHPWILPDAASDPATRFAPGTFVRIVSREEEALAWAHVEADPRLAARVWTKGAANSRQAPSIEARVARALARRRALLDPKDEKRTDAFRLIHGEGDDLPGLIVDRLGPLWRVLVTGRASDLIRERAIVALRAQLPVTPEGEEWSILELLHVRSPGSSLPDRVRWIAGGLEQLAEQDIRLEGPGFQVCERGLLYGVDPGWDTPRRVRPGYGLFVDQRENRARLDPLAARGGDWLNLFAHTGAFSVSLLAGGAAHVTSVDLSAAYLERLGANLSLNVDRGVDATRHTSIRGEGRRFLERLDAKERFAGIVLDPPTAAAAGRRFWSLQRDLEPILRQCVERLEAGGVLLVTQNRSGPPLGLDRVLERAAGRAHRSIARLRAAPAGVDHPMCPEFPEGDPFEGWLLELD